MHFKQVHIPRGDVSISVTLLSCSLAHGIPTQTQERLADRVRQVCTHVLSHNLHCFILCNMERKLIHFLIR